jgi:hypothetical protein
MWATALETSARASKNVAIMLIASFYESSKLISEKHFRHPFSRLNSFIFIINIVLDSQRVSLCLTKML